MSTREGSHSRDRGPLFFSLPLPTTSLSFPSSVLFWSSLIILVSLRICQLCGASEAGHIRDPVKHGLGTGNRRRMTGPAQALRIFSPFFFYWCGGRCTGILSGLFGLLMVSCSLTSLVLLSPPTHRCVFFFFFGILSTLAPPGRRTDPDERGCFLNVIRASN